MRVLWRVLVVALLFASGAVAAVVPASAAVADPAGVVRPATVKISFTAYGYDAQGRPATAEESGSGVIFDPRGYIVTNQHVVADADKTVRVTLVDGREFEATIIGADVLSDVAVVKIEGTNLPVAAFGDSASLPVGATVIALGHTPFLRDPTAGRPGRVIGLDGHIVSPGGSQSDDLIRTSISLFPGDSGGPLVDENGLVVGLNVIRLPNSATRTVDGLHIPAARVQSVARALISSGAVTRPELGPLGIQTVTVNSALAAFAGTRTTDGVLLQFVDPNGPAGQVGLEVGDVIVGVGEPPVRVRTKEEFDAEVAKYRPGQVIRLYGYDGRNRGFYVDIQL